eukprot:NODE_1069_length_1675_cov_27.158269_g1003_i0.p1 GENE.NODE_1069_length_1675_cov_27.158269_g1003_i0~~NODE_1069_length_1675_cov_27.158269_g1003_i0.p1  ORF type:complete len:505 (-),score=129.72 NODE_1069_length_1675_cov_27.158269_g1003_i0:107-1621(-)
MALDLLRRARDLVNKSAEDITLLDEAMPLIEQATEYHQLPTDLLIAQRVLYNVMMKNMGATRWQAALHCATHALNTIPDALAHGDSKTGDDFAVLEAWASCVKARCLATLGIEDESAEEWFCAHTRPRLLNRLACSPSTAPPMVAQAIFTLHRLVVPQLKAHTYPASLHTSLPLFATPVTDASARQHLVTWAVHLLNEGMELAQQFADTVNVKECTLEHIVPAIVPTSAYHTAQHFFALGFHLLTMVPPPLTEAAEAHVTRVVGASAWMGHSHLQVVGLRLLCTHHTHGGNPSAHALMNNQLVRLLAQWGHLLQAEQLLLQSSPTCPLAIADTHTTQAYLLSERDHHSAATALIVRTLSDLADMPPQQKPEWQRQHHQLVLRASFYFSLIQHRSGAADLSLPLAEECLAASPYGAQAFKPTSLIELVELVEVFLHAITLYALWGCLSESEYYLSQVKRICHSVLMAQSLPQSIPAARAVCKLPALTGAAIVCYGLPVYLQAAPC